MPNRGEDDAWEKYWDHVGNDELKEIWFGYYLELTEMLCSNAPAISGRAPLVIPTATPDFSQQYKPYEGRGRGRGKKGGNRGDKGSKGKGHA